MRVKSCKDCTYLKIRLPVLETGEIYRDQITGTRFKDKSIIYPSRQEQMAVKCVMDSMFGYDGKSREDYVIRDTIKNRKSWQTHAMFCELYDGEILTEREGWIDE